MKILQRIRSGRAKMRAEFLELEKTKLGTLRAGNSGILTAEGEVAGSCMRKAHLRQLGLEVDPPTDDKLIMFSLGIASEEIVAEELGRDLEPGEILLREHEIPISWQTSNGVTVSGRPDVVICRQSFEVDEKTGVVGKHITPLVGVELKTVHSVWSARGLLEEPKLPNVVQAAHYMWKLDIPYYLVYKGYSQLGQGMSWSPKMASMFPREGEPGSEIMSYKNGRPMEVRQFEISYELRINKQGRVGYRREDTTKWKDTIVNVADLERYYEYVAQMSYTRQLGNRPSTLSAHGEKLNYTECAYCPLQSVCDHHEAAGYGKWLEEVQKKLQSGHVAQ